MLSVMPFLRDPSNGPAAKGPTGSLVADGTALVGDFMRYGADARAVLALMFAGGILKGVGLALLVPIFSLLAPQIGGRWRIVADAADGRSYVVDLAGARSLR